MIKNEKITSAERVCLNLKTRLIFYVSNVMANALDVNYHNSMIIIYREIITLLVNNFSHMNKTLI